MDVIKFRVVLHLFSGRGRRRQRVGQTYLKSVHWGEMGKMPKNFTINANKNDALEMSKGRAEEFLKWTGRVGEVEAI